MKCKHCDGDGVIVDVEYGHAGKYGCKYCDGKGVVEPLTEQEWLQTATTEQLAEFLEKITDPHVGYLDGYWQKWLKQPHTLKE